MISLITKFKGENHGPNSQKQAKFNPATKPEPSLIVYIVMKTRLSQGLNLYSVSSFAGSDVSTETQLVSAYTHSLFLRAREPVCAISLSAHDTSLPGDDETGYSLLS